MTVVVVAVVPGCGASVLEELAAAAEEPVGLEASVMVMVEGAGPCCRPETSNP